MIDDVYELDEAPTEEQLTGVVALANRLRELEDVLQAQLDAAAKTKLELDRIAEIDLPEAMSVAGMDGFPLTGGAKVVITRKVVASIAKLETTRVLAHAWLRETGHGDLIKRVLKLEFGRGEDGLADRLRTWVRANLAKVKLSDSEAVHPQTLGAFVREQLSQGNELSEAITVVPIVRAEIERPARKKDTI